MRNANWIFFNKEKCFLVEKGLLFNISKYNLNLRMQPKLLSHCSPSPCYSIPLLILLANLLATSWIKCLLIFYLFYISYPASYFAFNFKTRSVKWLILICLKRKEKYSSVHRLPYKKVKKKENIGFNLSFAWTESVVVKKDINVSTEHCFYLINLEKLVLNLLRLVLVPFLLL